MPSTRQQQVDDLKNEIGALREENAGLLKRARDQADDLARLTGQVSTLERATLRLSNRIDTLSAAEEPVARSLQQQAAELRTLRDVEFQTLLERVMTLSARIEAQQAATDPPRPRVGSIRRFSRKLPEPVRRMLRHAYYTAVLIADPDNQRATHYRAFRITAARQATSLKEQKRLFERIVEAGAEGQLDIVIMPVIDWHFRIQRPQHLAKALAAAGHRVFYLTTTFSSSRQPAGFDVLESPAENVFICKLYCPEPHPTIYDSKHDDHSARRLAAGLEMMSENFHFKQTVSIVQHPFWRQVIERLNGTLVVYDCMDHHGAFVTGSDAQAEEEELLLQQSDLVVTTSSELSKLVARKAPNELIRNAADVDHFAETPGTLNVESDRPVVGYFGAISAWYDIELVTEMAKRFPGWDFVLVGSTFECNTSEAERLENIRFTGEVRYEELPGYLHAFDVCMIPFLITDLILCTNPVKVYEYLSAGKPVVATPMPELLLLRDYVHVAEGHDDFAGKLELAMKEKDDPQLTRRRKQWARQQTWESRGESLLGAIDRSYPKVSVVVLVYNNADVTKACLHSVEAHSHYPNLELIIVDNSSTDGVQEYLGSYMRNRPLGRIDDVRVIFNSENLGFSGGNNSGIAAATGDIVVLLNNDTYVTDGWILDLVRHFRETPDLGLVGPVTNNIGNEAKISIEYASMREMAVAAREYTRAHPRELMHVDNVAFFCVAMTRAVVEKVGLLDEEFGLGFFEDDDYCNRVRQNGYRIGIAENVFIHHHLSASFSALKQEERDAIFQRSRDVYERKWGAWKPHSYRSRA